ncbi:MAG: response regulator [Lachnospiraceae bacterium]|nr:response regulator [Lachnospiraceae bacterium]
MNQKYEKINSIIKWCTVLAMVSILLYAILGEIFLPSEREDESFFCEIYESAWTMILSDGSTEQIQLPGKIKTDYKNENSIEIRNILPTEIEEGTYLIFRTAKQDFTIYVDGELRKEYSTKNSRFMGNVSPTYYLFVDIGPDDAGKTIRVIAESPERHLGDFHFIYLANYGGFWLHMIQEQGRILVIGVIMLTLAFLSLILSLGFRIAYHKEQKLVSLSLGVIAVSVWIFANSAFRQLIFDNVSVIGDIAFFMVMIMPIPYADYMNQLQGKRYQKFYHAAEIMALLDLVVCTIIYACGLSDFAELFIIMALVLFFTLSIIVVSMIRDIFTGRIKDYWVSAAAFALATVVAVIQVLNYMNNDKAFDISIATLGLGLMLLVTIADTLSEMMKIQWERNRAVVANETKSQFLANMSHEIRTPINAVLGMNEMIMRETSEENILSYARDIDSSGHTLLSLVNDILDFSKVESGKMELIENDYDLKSMIDNILLLVKKRADEKALDLRVIINPLIPRFLFGDINRLQQAVTNLMTNAIKYTDTGYVELKIDFEKEQDNKIKLYIFVSDSGRGIKEEDAEKLFDAFQRMDEINNRNIEGTGLGLAITKRLVELMGGAIGVESKYGKGSCFWIHLEQTIRFDEPISEYHMEEKASVSDKKTYSWIVARGMKLLAVDDVAMNLKVLSGFLKKSEMIIDMCTSGAEAIEAWKKNKYDLVILDHMMPLMDGIECAKIMWSEPGPNEGVPIVMLTANAIHGMKEQYMDLGFADYLSKPYTQEQLNDVLCRNLPKGSFRLCQNSINSIEAGTTDTKEQDKQNASSEIKEQDEQNASSDTKDSEAYPVQINEKIGLEFCGGNRDFYLEMIREFAQDNQLDKLETYFSEKDWKQYRITVHALKGTSLTFGFENFSQEAKDMEMAVKSEDYAYVESNHEKLVTHYKQVISFIRENYGVEKK